MYIGYNNSIEYLKKFCKATMVDIKLRNVQVALRFIAQNFENVDKEIDEISLKATDLEKQVVELKEMIEERIINK